MIEEVKRNYLEISSLKDKNNILVATHCFTDAVHAYGETIFPDFYEWLMFLGYKSEKTKFKWLLKPHPAQAERNYDFLKFFENKFENFIKSQKFVNEVDEAYRSRVDEYQLQDRAL